MNLSLPDPMKNWVEDQARDGQFSNTSDYMRDLIRREQSRAQAQSELQSLIDSGLNSGPARVVDMAQFIKDRT